MHGQKNIKLRIKFLFR